MAERTLGEGSIGLVPALVASVPLVDAMMETPRPPGRVATALAIAGHAAAATCGILAVSLVALVLWRSATLLGLLCGAAIIAVVLDRPVAALVRRGLRRAWALALVLTGVGAISIAAAVVAVGPLAAQVRGLATAAPSVAEHLRDAVVARLGPSVEGTPLATSFHDALSQGAGALASGVYGAAGGIVTAAGAFATVLVTAVLLLASGPSLVHRAIAVLPPERRSWAEALARDVSISLGGYLAALGAIVSARILATGAFLTIARVPFIIPLALLAGASVLVPYLGSVLRVVAIGAVAWATRGSDSGLAALVFVASYDVIENYVISPLVYRKTLGISALAQLVAVLFLGYHFGVVGAVLAIPLAATAQIAVRAFRLPAAEPAAPEPEQELRRGAAGPTKQ